jgi:acetoin utilization deacetylase AcuC-like enzyme
VPLPSRSGNGAFTLITDRLIVPLVQKFRPSVILVSAGFDSHWDDPLTSLGLTTAGFHAISRALVELAGEWCKGRIVFVLEGGYNPVNIAHGVEAVFAALTNTEPGDDPRRSPYREPEFESRVEAVRKFHGF